MGEFSESGVLARLETEGFGAGREAGREQVLDGIECGHDPVEVVADVVEKLTEALFEELRPVGELMEVIRGAVEGLAPILGETGEALRGLVEPVMSGLEKGLEWLKANPEVTECILRGVFLIVMAAEDPETLLRILEQNPSRAADLFDFKPLIEALA